MYQLNVNASRVLNTFFVGYINVVLDKKIVASRTRVEREIKREQIDRQKERQRDREIKRLILLSKYYYKTNFI